MSKYGKVLILTAGLLLASLIITSIALFSFKVLAQQPNTNNSRPLRNTTNNTSNNITNNNNNNNNASTLIEPMRSTTGESRIEPNDLTTDTISKEHLTNPEIINKELMRLTPDQIKTFPINDVPTDELVIVLNTLSVQDLEKTLENIPAGDLAEIFKRLPQDKSQEILNRLPQDKSQEVSDRLTGELFK